MDAEKVLKVILENRKRSNDFRVHDKADLVRYLDNKFKAIIPDLRGTPFFMRIPVCDLHPYFGSVRDMESNLSKTINEIFERDTPSGSECYFKIYSLGFFVGDTGYEYRVEIGLMHISDK